MRTPGWIGCIAAAAGLFAVGALGLLASAPAYAATSDDDLSGSWSITTTEESHDVTGPGASRIPDAYKTQFPQSTPFTITCSAGTCSTDSGYLSGFNSTNEFKRSGGGWRSDGPFGPVAACQDGNSLVVTLVRQGSSLTGTAEVIQGSKSPVTDGAGACVAPELAYVAHTSFSIRGTLVENGVPTTSPTPTSAPVSPGRDAKPRDRAGPVDLTARQAESVAAVARKDRSSVPAALVTPREAFSDAGRIVQNALLAALLVLLLVFPSQLFNSTWEQHHDRIMVKLRRWRPRRAEAPAAGMHATAGRSQLPLFVGVAVAGAVLGGFLDPKFGFNGASIALVIGVLLAILATTAASGLAGVGYRRLRDLPSSRGIRAIPAGLAIAAMCVVVSRLVDFRPGYLYGLVGGLVFAVALDARDAGRAELVALATGLAVAMLAWLVFVPVSDAANSANPGFGIQLLDTVLAALFIGGIEGLLFNLVPLKFMPGHRVAQFSWVAWLLSAGIAAFVFVEVLLRPANGYLGTSSTASVVVTYGLFGAFGAASVVFWGWFRFRPDPALTSRT